MQRPFGCAQAPVKFALALLLSLLLAASAGDNVAVASATANMTFTIDLRRMSEPPRNLPAREIPIVATGGQAPVLGKDSLA